MNKKTNSHSPLPGLKPVLELINQNPEKIVKVYCRQNRAEKIKNLENACSPACLPLEVVDNETLDALCKGGRSINHQGVVAIIKNENRLELEPLLNLALSSPLPLILAFDQIQDSGNLGTLCRTAYALGCAGIILPKHNSAVVGPGAYKASAGALGHLPYAIVTNLARALDLAEEKEFHIYGAACAKNCESENAFTCVWQKPAILVLGNEDKGIRPGVLKRCGINVHIPFARGFDSLNIAQAGAIIMGLFAAQKDNRKEREVSNVIP